MSERAIEAAVQDAIEALERGSSTAPVVECLRAALAAADRVAGEDVWKTENALLAALNEPCPYCSDGARTGLPGNACENCMNTGLKYPRVAQAALALSPGKVSE